MKKTVSFLLSLLMLISAFTILPVTANAEDEAKVTLTSKQGFFDDYTKSYKKGDTFSVKIDLESKKIVHSSQIYLNFDHNKLRCIDLVFMNGGNGAVATSITEELQKRGNKVVANCSNVEGYNYKSKNTFINATFELLDASAPATIEFDLYLLGFIMDESNMDKYENVVEDSVADNNSMVYYVFSIDKSDTEKQSGETGDCRWEYSQSFSTLTISGSGKMQDYTKPSDRPWNSFVNEITRIVIGYGVENIGSYAFKDTQIEKITIPDSVTEIGEAAFFNCSKLKNIDFGNSIKSIGAYAFANTKDDAITIPESIERLDDYCLGYKEDTTSYKYVPYGFNIYGFRNTEAERYANDNGFRFIPLDYTGSVIHQVIVFVTAPEADKKPSYDLTVPLNQRYKKEDTLNGSGWHNGISWYDENGNPLGDNDVFKGGKNYKVRVSLLTANEEYEFNGETNLIDAYVRSEKASAGWFNYDTRTKNIYVQYTFTCEAKPIANCTVSDVKAKTYNGKEQTQSVTVEEGSKTLTSGTDYTVSYENNTNAGTATMTITGTGEYKDTLVKSFKINKAENTVKVTVKTKSVKLKKLKKKAQTVKAITVKSAQGNVTYKLSKKGSTAKLFKLAKINSKGVIKINKWKKAKKGDYKLKVKITAAGNKNYNKKTVNKVVKVKIK